jgi:hypothetical protein
LDRKLKEASGIKYLKVGPAMPLLVDKILGSEEYMELVNIIGLDAELSAVEIIQQLQKKPVIVVPNDNPRNIEFSAQSHDSKVSWSLGSLSSGVYPGSEDLMTIEKQLQPMQPLGVRKNAVQVSCF